MAYMDLHAVERLLSALDHSTAYLKALDVDCPHYYPFSFWSDTCKHSFHSIWNAPTLSTSPAPFDSIIPHPCSVVNAGAGPRDGHAAWA